MKNRLLAVAAAGEALTGLVLLVYPPILVNLLFGAAIDDMGVVTSRFAGLALKQTMKTHRNFSKLIAH